MTAVFADTSFYLALLNPADELHQSATAAAKATTGRIVTSDFVIVELGNALTSSKTRKLFAEFVHELRTDRNTRIFPCSRSLLDSGLKLYSMRTDKEWSLVDCTSFVIMRRHGLKSALSADRHFQQAGFEVLMR